MNGFFLGADVGSTHTRVLISDQAGKLIGYGENGPGNHEMVGYEGFTQALKEASDQALYALGIEKSQIMGAGFGVSGYDWSLEREATVQAIYKLGINAPFELVNDTLLGLIAGSQRGWGIVIISGSGCNCRGWDKYHTCEGRVTGAGTFMGEGAGASELMDKVIHALAYEWTQRGETTALTPALMEYVGAHSLADLLEGLINQRYTLDASAVPLVFQVAQKGDPVAVNLLAWAGNELGELAKAVIRQLGFKDLAFEIILSGGMFEGGALLIDPLKQNVLKFAPRAVFVRLTTKPVVGAVLLGMQAAGVSTDEARQRLKGLLRLDGE